MTTTASTSESTARSGPAGPTLHSGIGGRRRALEILLLGSLAASGCQADQAWNDQVASGRAAGGGVEIGYRVVGRGPDTVVVVGGGPGLTMDYLEPAVQPLAGEITWILYDPRGRGTSAAIDDRAPVGLAEDLDDLETIRSRFQLERMVLMGHNWGGAVAAHYAARRPERVDRLLLVSPYPISQVFVYGWNLLPRDTTRFREGALAAAAATDPAGWTKFCHAYWFWYFQPVYLPENIDDRVAAKAVCAASSEALVDPGTYQRRHLFTSAAHDWTEAFRSIQAPTLVLEGSPPRSEHRLYQVHAERWAQSIPAARVLLLPGGALLPWVANSAGFTMAAREFLTGAYPSSAYLPTPTDSVTAANPSTPGSNP